MKKILITMLLILISNFAFSQELIIVVAPFEVREGSGFSKDDVEAIEYLFISELSKNNTIKVLDQSNAMFKEITKRMEFELSDWSNPNKVAEFGKALNANAVVLGRIMKLFDEIIIAARINDLSTEIKAANDMVIKNVSEVRGKIPAFTKEIVNRLPKSKNELDAQNKIREEKEREALAENRKKTFDNYKKNANRNYWDYMNGYFLWGDDGLVGVGGMMLAGGIHWSPIPFISIGAETAFCGWFDGNYYGTGSFVTGLVFPLKIKDEPRVLVFCDGILDIGKFGSYTGLFANVLTPSADVGLSFRWDLGFDIKYKRTFLDGYVINGINVVLLWDF
ncbi:MAG: hypothetical protein LBC76_07330 [Treponema sp.]|jgi:TolB-like protein|nr:hypothetical protein [Treponema sp.]